MFLCGSCNEIVKTEVEIPRPNFTAEKISDSRNFGDSSEIICECGKEYEITGDASMMDWDITIEGKVMPENFYYRILSNLEVDIDIDDFEEHEWEMEREYMSYVGSIIETLINILTNKEKTTKGKLVSLVKEIDINLYNKYFKLDLQIHDSFLILMNEYWYVKFFTLKTAKPYNFIIKRTALGEEVYRDNLEDPGNIELREQFVELLKKGNEDLTTDFT